LKQRGVASLVLALWREVMRRDPSTNGFYREQIAGHSADVRAR
jgi:hypothetical protein